MIMIHKFVDFIPEKLEQEVLYISLTYNTAIHKCSCGCGEEVVTPISPTDWNIIYNGEAISLYPSIGNWSFACQSHYWIRENKVIWAEPLSDIEIENGRFNDRLAKQRYYNQKRISKKFNPKSNSDNADIEKRSFVYRMLKKIWH